MILYSLSTRFSLHCICLIEQLMSRDESCDLYLRFWWEQRRIALTKTWELQPWQSQSRGLRHCLYDAKTSVFQLAFLSFRYCVTKFAEWKTLLAFLLSRAALTSTPICRSVTLGSNTTISFRSVWKSINITKLEFCSKFVRNCCFSLFQTIRASNYVSRVSRKLRLIDYLCRQFSHVSNCQEETIIAHCAYIVSGYNILGVETQTMRKWDHPHHSPDSFSADGVNAKKAIDGFLITLYSKCTISYCHPCVQDTSHNVHGVKPAICICPCNAIFFPLSMKHVLFVPLQKIYPHHKNQILTIPSLHALLNMYSTSSDDIVERERSIRRHWKYKTLNVQT